MYYDYDCIIHIDGGCKKNSKEGREKGTPSAAAFVVVKMPDFDGDYDYYVYNPFMYAKGNFYRGKTNNEMEYYALILALNQIIQEVEVFPQYYIDEFKRNGKNYKVLIQSDSKVIVNQVSSEWNINCKQMMHLNSQAKQLINVLKKYGVDVQLRWFDRKYNLADEICNLIISTGLSINNIDWFTKNGEFTKWKNY